MPPGSRLPGVIQAVLYARDPVGFLERHQRRYGDVFSLPFPAFGTLVYVADPDLVKRVFTGDPTTFRAGTANARALEPVLGRFSLLTLDGDDHMRQRKLLLPPFHGEAVRRYRDLIAEIAAREVERWPVGRPFELRPRMQAITLEVILRAVFGVRGEERLGRFRALLPRLTDSTGVQMWIPFLRRNLGPWSPWGRFLRMRAEVDELVYDEIRRRRAEPGAAERDDVLSLLLGARHEDGSPMSDRELRDELITLLTAGHETSATALAWAFERLLRNPGAMRELRAEVERGGDDYADAVVKETLRVRPVITDVARLVTTDVELGRWIVPAGTIVVPAIALLQLLPQVYSDPYVFRPERFLAGQPAPYTWIPFGGGVRRCLGAAFAQLEIRTVLQTVVARAELRAPDAAPERTRLRNVTLVPQRGARVVMDGRPATVEPAAATATYA
ncbi:MAG: cytochrome P450 [Solirubrobacterales bacterium]